MDPTRRREFVFLAIAAALCGTIPLLFPADAPWISDEPALFTEAWHVVHRMGIPSHGLSGSVGLPYGPVPVLIYSLALLITHNLVLLVFLRALFFMLAMGFAVWCLASMCPTLSPPVGVLALLSPYYWYFSRVLWDNSFLIPFSALTLVAYIAFCRAPATWKLCLVGLGMVLMLQTHLMCLPFLASIVLHFLWQYRSWARKHVAQCLAIVAIGFAACLPYLLSLARPVAGTPLSAPSRSATSWLFPLMGGRFFSSIGLDYFFGKNWQNSSGLPALLWLLTWVSALGLITFWIGLAEAWRFLAKNLRSPGERPVEFHLWSVVCLTLLLQIVMSGVADTGNHPHYYNGTSFCAFTLVWLAYSEVKNRRWRWIGAGLHAASLLAILLMTVGRIHQTQGNTSIHYGPTLGTQLEILRELDFQNPQTVVFNETSHYSSFPEAFSVLQILYPLHFSPSAPVRRLVIRYADPQSGAGRLAVAEASPETTDKQMMRLR